MSGRATQVSVIGAGSWGTALALLLARNGVHLRLWSHQPEHVERMQQEGENAAYLPGQAFPEQLTVDGDWDRVVQSPYLLVVVPSVAFRDVVQRLAQSIKPRQSVIWATKGLDHSRSELLHQVARSLLPELTPLGVLSGPTFAEEVASGMPTAITLASTDVGIAEHMTSMLVNDRFRVYISHDLVGVELGGALKNVLAIAAGISDGLGFGANARAALITRGLAEIMRLGHALGAQPETLMGLTGVGDLVLTCTDNQSRNRRFGLALGQGIPPERARQDIGQAIEGADTAKVVMQLAQQHDVDMPICEQVCRVLYDGQSPRRAAEALFDRQIRHEQDGSAAPLKSN